MVTDLSGYEKTAHKTLSCTRGKRVSTAVTS